MRAPERMSERVSEWLSTRASSRASGRRSQGGRLKPEYLPAHPHYPYPNHNGEVDVDHMLSAWFKLSVVGELRNRSRAARGVTYDLVWRTRPDFYTVNIPWPLLRRLVSRARTHADCGSQGGAAHERGHGQLPSPWFLTPTLDPRWPSYMTDVEAFLSEPAAARYDSFWWSAPSLYARGVVLHPETMLYTLMTANLSRVYDRAMMLIRCFPSRRVTPQAHSKRSGSPHTPVCAPWGNPRLNWTSKPRFMQTEAAGDDAQNAREPSTTPDARASLIGRGSKPFYHALC